MTADLLSAIAGAVLSLYLFYAPPNWKFGYDNLLPEYKRLVMLVLLIVVSGAAYGLACAGFAADFDLPLTCDRLGAVGLIRALIVAIGGNQLVYNASKTLKR